MSYHSRLKALSAIILGQRLLSSMIYLQLCCQYYTVWVFTYLQYVLLLMQILQGVKHYVSVYF